MIQTIKDAYKAFNQAYPNWKTTFFGLGLAIGFAVDDAMSAGGLTWRTAIKVAFSAGLGYMAKYYKATGGTVATTYEGTARLAREAKIEEKVVSGTPVGLAVAEAANTKLSPADVEVARAEGG